MRNKLPFFLILALSAMTVLTFSSEASAQWQRIERKPAKPEKPHRSQVITRGGSREERTIIVRPATRVSVNRDSYENESYSRNERYYENYNSPNVAQIARLKGYEDGLHEGTKDARDGDRYDPFAEHDYEDGADGYKSRYGNRAAYQQLYRQAFIRGYREAFNRYLGSGAVERNW